MFIVTEEEKCKSEGEIEELLDKSIDEMETVAKKGGNILVDLIIGTAKNKLKKLIEDNKIIVKTEKEDDGD